MGILVVGVDAGLAFTELGGFFARPLTAGLPGPPFTFVGMLVLTPVTGLGPILALGVELASAAGPELGLPIDPFDDAVGGLELCPEGLAVVAVVRFGTSTTFFSVVGVLAVVINVLEGPLVFAGAE